ncbi:MAG TPA: divalent-cation tolerance protein CutA [Gemmatimonadales bacterium]|nr:divalent-cation tolerance protein CutA [Gemmatimonadales bacterium]
MPDAPEVAVVLTTVSSTDEAMDLVRELVTRRLAACGTILPEARSIYRWKDQLSVEGEVVVILKTRSAMLNDLKSAFSELHPYAVPELLALPVADGLPRYLGWIASETAELEA